MSLAELETAGRSAIERQAIRAYESLGDDQLSATEVQPAPGDLECPSMPLLRGGRAIAIRDTSDDRFEFFAETFPLSPGLLSDSLAHSVQARLRVSGPCIRSACESWTSSGCRWGRAVASAGGRHVDASPTCPIRGVSTWIAENGDSVCRVCPKLAY